ncbi:uncharacterized protein LOC113272477 [Papaver somniferum]|uniref:uncharacterized protein LOC113272477 n=1 Tax=Papaver somniferum TaxID=3469 RepID=UPI000E702360|nr:uncharacterized protein LOC113272477 [Papaver somniferum]
MTKPDISFSVNYVAQFTHKPIENHFLTAKRILRYLKGTLGSGITLSSEDFSSLSAYCDSDWDGMPEDLLLAFVYFLVILWSPGPQRSILPSTDLQQRLDINIWLLL